MGNGSEIERRGTKDMSVSNRLLLENARYSPKEIEERTGIPAIDAVTRINELLESRDWLTMRQREQLLIIDLEDMIDDLKKRMQNAADEDYAAIATVSVRAMKLISERFDAQRRAVEQDITRITSAQAKMFGVSYDAALETLLNGLEEAHPDIDRAELRTLTRQGMIAAKQKLEEYVDDE